jgi:hypothetical protein
MGKIWATLGLALLAGCGKGSAGNYGRQEVTVTIANTGTGSAYGKAEGWNGEDEHKFNLSPGASTSFVTFVDYRLKVHIWRSMDNLVLIDDFWDTDDLRKMEDLLVVTVSP